MRRVLDLVRGKRVDEALNMLHFTHESAPRCRLKRQFVLLLQILEIFEEGQRIDLDQIYIKEAFVNQGPTLKRFRPMSMGRAGKIRKRTSHLTIVIEDSK